MSKFLTDSTIYPAIAAAIRAKGGATGLLKPSEMPAAIRNISGGGSSAVLEPLIVTANGNYTPGVGVDGFDSVSVDVPNSYAEADEGKVVQSGALVAQTSLNVTANGTYDTTTNNSVVVDVEGGGGDDPFLLTDYIQSSGTQYIDTGYIIKANTLLEIVCTPSKTGSTYPHIFGCRVDWRNNTCGLQFAQSNGNTALFSWSNRTSADEISISNSAYNGVKLCISASSGGIKFQGESQYLVNGYINTYDSTPVCPYSLGLFIQHTGGSGGDFFNTDTTISMKLYRFRIYEGSALVMELLPAVDSNNVVCLRDTVSGNYFYNQGTGVFTYGSDT